jgi:hypothetical protein
MVCIPSHHSHKNDAVVSWEGHAIHVSSSQAYYPLDHEESLLMEVASRPDPHLSSWMSAFKPILGEKSVPLQVMKALL